VEEVFMPFAAFSSIWLRNWAMAAATAAIAP
jgi:hypothetical protein